MTAANGSSGGTLPPCPVCGEHEWPRAFIDPETVAAVRDAHIAAHDRGLAAGFRTGLGAKPARKPVTWPDVAMLAVVGFVLVAVAWACAWGVRG